MLAQIAGIALALPEKVVLARPTGFGRGDAMRFRIPIQGAGEWLRLGKGA